MRYESLGGGGRGMKHEPASAVSAASQHTIGDLLRRTAQRCAGKPAIRCGTVEWSYAEFDRVCDALARGLAGRGIAPGDRVAILSRNSHAFAAMRFAIARLGAVLVPINFMLNAKEIGFILQNSGARCLVVAPGLLEVGRAALAECPSVTLVVGVPGEGAEAPADVD